MDQLEEAQQSEPNRQSIDLFTLIELLNQTMKNNQVNEFSRVAEIFDEKLNQTEKTVDTLEKMMGPVENSNDSWWYNYSLKRLSQIDSV